MVTSPLFRLKAVLAGHSLESFLTLQPNNNKALKKPLLPPGLYKWFGNSITLALAVSSLLLFLFRYWPIYRTLDTPDLTLPFVFLVMLHFIALIAAGFGVQVVMGNISGNPEVKPARKFFGIWLFLHSVWLVLFAGLNLPVFSLGFGMFEWGISVFCIQKFFHVDPKAGQRVLLFFVMTTYLMYLNAAVISLNDL